MLARRILTLNENGERSSVEVQIGPLTNHAASSSCHIGISGIHGELHYDIHGIDEVQALQLALRFTGSELDRLGGDGWEYLNQSGHGFDSIVLPERK